MNDLTSFFTRWARTAHGPLQVGVSLQRERWQVVLLEPAAQGLSSHGSMPWADALERLQYRHWHAESLHDLFAAQDRWLAGVAPTSVQESLDAAQLAAWPLVLEAVRRLVPDEACHLVVSWPDEALWSTTITLAGPVTEDEWSLLVQQELAMVMPVAVDQAAWDARLLGQPLQARPTSGGWRSMLHGSGAVWAFRPRVTWDGDTAWQCWAMPRALASRINAMARQLGFASLSIEPSSVSVQRAAVLQQAWSEPAHASASTAWQVSSEVAEALGAACRQSREEPDLLRHRSTVWIDKGRQWVRKSWPSWLALAAMAALGWVLGGMHLNGWARDQEASSQRLQQLQAVQQAQDRAHQVRQQARAWQLEHEERTTYNQQFAQMLQGWAATVPEGVRWQQLSLRPRHIELRGQALGADSFTRWIDAWPRTLPAGVQHQLQWQTASGTAPGARAEPGVGLQVQLSWGLAAERRE